MEVQRYYPINFHAIEELILSLGDEFDICIEINESTGLFAITLGLVGSIVGGVLGGRVGSLVGAGVGAISGVGVSKLVALREIWPKVKETLKQIYYIVYNFLRQLDSQDFLQALHIFRSSRNRYLLVMNLIEFIADRMSTNVSSSLHYHSHAL